MARNTHTQAPAPAEAEAPAPAERKKRRKRLEESRPYGTVHGIGEAKYEQDGKLFGSDCMELGEPQDDGESGEDEPATPDDGSQTETTAVVIDEAALAGMVSE